MFNLNALLPVLLHTLSWLVWTSSAEEFLLLCSNLLFKLSRYIITVLKLTDCFGSGMNTSAPQMEHRILTGRAFG